MYDWIQKPSNINSGRVPQNNVQYALAVYDSWKPKKHRRFFTTPNGQGLHSATLLSTFCIAKLNCYPRQFCVIPCMWVHVKPMEGFCNQSVNYTIITNLAGLAGSGAKGIGKFRMQIDMFNTISGSHFISIVSKCLHYTSEGCSASILVYSSHLSLGDYGCYGRSKKEPFLFAKTGNDPQGWLWALAWSTAFQGNLVVHWYCPATFTKSILWCKLHYTVALVKFWSSSATAGGPTCCEWTAAHGW